MPNTKIPIVFIGTSDIGAPLLETLKKDGRFEIKRVITQIDRPAGRKLEPTPSPIKQKAEELKLPVYQPANINAPESLEEIRHAKPEMIVLMAYGQILKKDILTIPRLGCINVHGSILPKFRGASPIQQVLLAGEKQTGISIMQMAEKMDAGPVFSTHSIGVDPSDDAETLILKLARLTAQKTPDDLVAIFEGKLSAKPQDESKVTYCQKIAKADGEIKWSESAETILRKIRAYTGWPGTYTFWEEKRLKILKAKLSSLKTSDKPGAVRETEGKILISTGDGALELAEVQMEGKKAQPIGEFIKGHLKFMGSELG